MTPDRVLELLGRDPSRTALLFDFDGSLAPIVDDPATAAAVDGARDVLDRLADRYARVAVVSGRPLAFLADQVGPAVDLSGLYGIETRIDGRVSAHLDADRWRAVVDAVVAGRTGGGDVPAGLALEPKGVSLTVHYRTRPDLAGAARRWATDTAAVSGLEVRPAKASFELHPPIDASKATAVRVLVDGCTTVSFVGDDIGDLPAFAALDRLAADGVTVVKAACGGPELPAPVAETAHLVLADPAATVALFAALVEP